MFKIYLFSSSIVAPMKCLNYYDGIEKSGDTKNWIGLAEYVSQQKFLEKKII